MDTQRIALDADQHHTAVMQADGTLLIQAQDGHTQTQLSAEETYNLLVWLYNAHRDTLYDLTHQGPQQNQAPPPWRYKYEA
jgi:hypothetical protein